jgi:hypothetical protein
MYDHGHGAMTPLLVLENAWLAEKSEKRKREMERDIAMNVHASG